MAEDALAQNRVDLISVTRALLADPEWLTKAQRGEEESIRRCIGCTRCINDREHGGLICSVNPFERHEDEWTITPAPQSKRILVVGGGPIAARRIRVLREFGCRILAVAPEAATDIKEMEKETPEAVRWLQGTYEKTDPLGMDGRPLTFRSGGRRSRSQ